MAEDDELHKILNQHFPADEQEAAEAEESRGGFKWIATLFAVLFAAGAVGLMFYGYQWWQKQRPADDGNLPVIAGPSDTVKNRPANEGGMAIPHQDATIYDEINKDKTTAAAGEQMLPAAEEPVEDTAALPAADSGDTPLLSDAAPPNTIMNPAIPAPPISTTVPSTVTTAPPAPAANIKEPLPYADETSAAAAAAAAPAPAPEKTAPAKPAAKAIEKAAPRIAAEPSAKNAPAGNATFNIQLAAVRNDPGLADQEWKNIEARVGGLLKGINHLMPQVQVGQYTMVRLQAGPLTHEDALALCAKLKAKNQSCMVVKR